MTTLLEPPTVAAHADWRQEARCQHEPETFCITAPEDGDEPPYPTKEQTLCCGLCPVRNECLEYALKQNEPAGVWGGMTRYQRTLLARVRSRQSCPGCGAHDVITEGGTGRQHEVCVACGISWYV